MNRKFKFVIIVFLLIVASVLGYFSLKINQQEPTSPAQKTTYHLLSPPDLELISIFTKPGLKEIEPVFNDLPEKLLVYRIEPALINIDQAEKIATTFDFTEEQLDQEENQEYRWISQQKALIVSPREARIKYVVDLLNFPGLLQAGKLPSPSQDQERIVSFLTENIVTPLPSTELKLRNWHYLRIRGPQFEETTPEKAQLIKFNFDLILNGYPIITNSPQEGLVSVIVGPEFKIYQLHYQIPFAETSQNDDYPLKDKTEITNEILNRPQTTTLIREDHQIANISNYNQIEAINITDAKVGYFIPLEGKIQYLQPVFYFEAKGVLPETRFTTFFLIPAIKNKYLSPGL